MVPGGPLVRLRRANAENGDFLGFYGPDKLLWPGHVCVSRQDILYKETGEDQ